MNDKIIQPSEWSFTYKNQASNTTWVTVNSDNVYTKAHYNGSSNGCINAQYYIDLTNYTEITVVSTYFKRAWGRYIPIFVKNTNSVVEISGSWVKKLEPWDTTGTQQEGTTQIFTLDVSDLNGYYYVGWGIQGSGDYAECTVHSFTLQGEYLEDDQFWKVEGVVTKTYNDWGVWSANTYINSSGGYGTGDTYWQVKAPIDVSYEASVGGSFKITGMTFFESNRTYVNFFSADKETIASSTTSNVNTYRISTVYVNTQNQVISVPSNAKSMLMAVRTISPNEIATVNVTLRQRGLVWNTSDSKEPHDGIYDFDGVTNYVIGKLYDYDGTASYQIGKVYDYDGTTSYLIYNSHSPSESLILDLDDQKTSITGGWTIGNKGSYAYTQGYTTGDKAWVMRYSGNNWSGAGWMQTKNKIEINGYTKIRLTLSSHEGYGDASKSSGQIYIALVNNPSTSGDNATGYCGGTPSNRNANGWSSTENPPYKYIQKLFSGTQAKQGFDLDVSDVDGSYYVQIGRYNQGAYGTFSSFFYSVEFID